MLPGHATGMRMAGDLNSKLISFSRRHLMCLEAVNLSPSGAIIFSHLRQHDSDLWSALDLSILLKQPRATVYDKLRIMKLSNLIRQEGSTFQINQEGIALHDQLMGEIIQVCLGQRHTFSHELIRTLRFLRQSTKNSIGLDNGEIRFNFSPLNFTE